MDFDYEENVKKYNNSIINSLNKNLENKLSKEIKEKINNKNSCLLIGDSLEDIGMVSRKQIENTLTIGLLNENIEENVDIYKENFDIVLTEKDGSFYEIMKLIF